MTRIRRPTQGITFGHPSHPSQVSHYTPGPPPSPSVYAAAAATKPYVPKPPKGLTSGPSTTGNPNGGRPLVGFNTGQLLPSAQSPVTDPGLLAAQDQGFRQTGAADASALFQQNQLNAAYGFDAAGNIDPNNPYSRAALLQESYKRSRAGTKNSYAAAGQLYSSAHQRGEDEATRNYNIGYDQLQKGYQGDRGKILMDQLAAYASATGGVGSAAFQALLKQLNGGS